MAGIVAGVILAVTFFCTCCCAGGGLYTVNPGQATILEIFGQYKGTVRGNGIFWVNPFYTRSFMNLRQSVHHSNTIVVNDKGGNPIEIGVVLIWVVDDTFRANYDVDSY